MVKKKYHAYRYSVVTLTYVSLEKLITVNFFYLCKLKAKCFACSRAHDDIIKWKHVLRYWPFVREPIGHRWITHTKTSDAELWCFLWSVPEQMVEQIVGTLVIWDAIVLIMTSLWCCAQDDISCILIFSSNLDVGKFLVPRMVWPLSAFMKPQHWGSRLDLLWPACDLWAPFECSFMSSLFKSF